jgi:hypothetical protein
MIAFLKKLEARFKYHIWWDMQDWYMYLLGQKHPPRNISRIRHWIDYYLGRNPLGPPYYGVWCISNAYHNTGLRSWIHLKKKQLTSSVQK